MSAAREELFDAIVEENQSALISYAGWFVHDADLAREVACEAFRRFVKQVPMVEGREARIRLFVFCRARALAAKRRLPAASTPPVRWRKSAGETDESSVENSGFPAAAGILAHLGGKFREPMLLRFQHGFTSREIARIIGQPSGRVLAFLHAGMKSLPGLFPDTP